MPIIVLDKKPNKTVGNMVIRIDEIIKKINILLPNLFCLLLVFRVELSYAISE